jgi:hypothetical protein
MICQNLLWAIRNNYGLSSYFARRNDARRVCGSFLANGTGDAVLQSTQIFPRFDAAGQKNVTSVTQMLVDHNVLEYRVRYENACNSLPLAPTLAILSGILPDKLPEKERNAWTRSQPEQRARN